MRLVFMGTPDFAVPTLEGLLGAGHEIALVITQPDRPAGRGHKLVAPPVKMAALAHGLSVVQPARLREPGVQPALVAAAPEAIVVAAFGQILPAWVLDLPPLGCLNVHASLLPRWRGAAPIAAAILAGDEETGVTIMRMAAGLDTGPVLAQAATEIGVTETTGELTVRLAGLGANLLLEILPRWAAGALTPLPQHDAEATYAGRLRKESGRLDWSQPASVLWRRCRAFQPWPGAFTEWADQPLKVLTALPLSTGPEPPPPGTASLLPAADARQRAMLPDELPARGQVLAVSCGEGQLALLRVQPAGGKPRGGDEFARGQRNLVGARLGDPPTL